MAQSLKSPPSQPFSSVFSCFGGLVPKVLHIMVQQNRVAKSAHFYIHHMEKSHSVRFKLDGFSRVLQVGDAAHAFEKRRSTRVQSIFAMSNAKIQAISNPEQIQGRNEAIRKMGAPNVNGFKLIMQQNP